MLNMSENLPKNFSESSLAAQTRVRAGNIEVPDGEKYRNAELVVVENRAAALHQIELLSKQGIEVKKYKTPFRANVERTSGAIESWLCIGEIMCNGTPYRVVIHKDAGLTDQKSNKDRGYLTRFESHEKFAELNPTLVHAEAIEEVPEEPTSLLQKIRAKVASLLRKSE